jgi:hypothetical protein
MLGGDHCLSALLSIFEYLTNGALDVMEEAGAEGEPWVTVKMSELVATMDSLFSERSIRDRLEQLVASGILTRRRGDRGESNSYLLDYQRINDMIADGSVVEFFDGKIADDFSTAKLPPGTGKIADEPPAKLPPYKEIEERIEKTVQNNTAPAAQDVGTSARNETQNPDARLEAQTPTQGAPGLPQMGAELAVPEITGIYRQAKGAKRPKWNTKQGVANLEKLASLIEDLGYDTVIGAIKAYVWDFQPDVPSLKDKPLDWILTSARILSFAGVNKTPRREAPAVPDVPAPPRTAPTAPPVSRAPQTGPAPGFRDPDVLGFWNATMPPQCQAPVLTAVTKQALAACSAEPEFARRWMDLVKLAAQVAASGKLKFKPTLSWFLRDGWAKLANHDFDWALPEGAPVSGETPAEDAGEPYGVMERDAIESAITALMCRSFITPVRRDDILDERRHLRKVWDTQGGEFAYREFADYIRKTLTRSEQAAWFPLISHVARKRLVEVVEKFKI